MFNGTSTKIVSQRTAAKAAGRLRRAGKKIVATNGSFDILHAGHVAMLEGSRRLGDALFVYLNNDNSIRSNKGKGRPVVPARERALLLAALACVDFVVVFGGRDPDRLLVELKPHRYTKGGSFIDERLKATRKLLAGGGCKTVLLPMKGKLSTSAIIDKCKRLR